MIDQREAAKYLLKLKRAALGFPGFMEFYYPEFEYAPFQKEMQEVLDLLEKDALLSKGGNPVRNVLVTMPPRHAKSFHTTINMPAYELLRKPYREVMVSAYNGDLATTFGRATRDIAADSKVMKAFKEFQLSRETRAVDFWKTTAGGAYYAVGLNGTTTGRGVNCLTRDSQLWITTGRGEIKQMSIFDVVTERIAGHVLCFDHVSESPTWGRIIGYSETPASELFEVCDSAGGVVRATEEHPFYVVGRGYVEAKDLAPGDILLRLLPEGGPEAGVRCDQVDQERTQGSVLLPRLQQEAPLVQEHEALPSLRQAGQDEQGGGAMLAGVQGGGQAAEADQARSPMCAVPQGVRGKAGYIKVLFQGLQEFASLAINAVTRQPKIRARPLRGQEAASHNQGVHQSEVEDKTTGRYGVRGVQVGEEIARPPHRPQPDEQRLEQLGDSVPGLSQQAPQTLRRYEEVTVSLVKRVRRDCLVYNISVEKHENYFANGVLTHNCLHVDDPIKSREEADSTLMRRRVWDFYTSGLLSRLQPDRDGQPPYQVVTMTRWHPDDMAGRIMESQEFKRGEWLHLNFMALRVSERSFYVKRSTLPVDHPGYIPAVVLQDVEQGVESKREMVFPRTHRGKDKGVRTHLLEHKDQTEQALWPERFPVEWLRKQKTLLGDRDFEALYQQNPYVIGGNLIKENWFRRYKPEQLPEDMHAVAISADTAFKAKQANDYSVFTIGGITEVGDIYILGVVRQKMEFPDLKRKASALNAAWRGRGLRGLWVEDAASGQSLAQELRASTSIPVLMWKPGSQDKFARANSITPLIEAGRVFIPEEADWLDDWLSEMASFPSSKHDDQVDSLVILLDVLSRMVVTGMKEFDAPLGYVVERLANKGDLLFANQPLLANPKGWAGDAQLSEAMRGQPWKGWGV